MSGSRASNGARRFKDAERPKVVLVDDSEVVRRGLALVLDRLLHMEVSECGSAEQALAHITAEPVDVALIDVRMPGRDGLWVLERLREERPDLPVLMLSTFQTEDYVDRAIEMGAAGYLLKDSTTQQLSEAIDTALCGRGVYLHPVVAGRMIERSASVDDDVPPLTEREQEVLRLVARGDTNDEIAGHLFVTEKTVKSHLSNIFRKLDVHNRTQAAAKAIRDGLVAS